MGSHKCREGEGFMVLLAAGGGYPRVIFRCEVCGKDLRRIPLDDLSNEDIDLAVRMMELYRAGGKI